MVRKFSHELVIMQLTRKELGSLETIPRTDKSSAVNILFRIIPLIFVIHTTRNHFYRSLLIKLYNNGIKIST